jgi:DNA-binding beta-propeller fold protein YncE
MSHAKVQRRKGSDASGLCVIAPWREAIPFQQWLRIGALSLAVISGIPLTAAKAANPATETVLSGLHHPCGIALRPNGTADKYELFIADSGAGRVVAWSNHERAKSTEVITGFAASAVGESATQASPRSLLFIDPGLLAVGGAADGGNLVQIYELPEEGKTILADAANLGRHTKPVAAQPTSRATSGSVACTSLARTRANDIVQDALVMVASGGGAPIELLKSRMQAGVLGQPRPFSSLSFANKAESSAAVAATNSGRIVVASDHRIAFLNPLDGNVELELSTDLSSPRGLAYSPLTGNLFAADFERGVYRLDDASEPSKPACRAVRIGEISQPTSLAFAPDGALYVTTLGRGDGDGTLQVLTGDL